MADVSLQIPLFPLPNLVFFPGTHLPLHVFEPRYKAMIGDAIAGEELIGVVQLRPGWEENYYETPAIYKTLTVGKIEQYEKFDDGRYDILLSGQHRVHVRSEDVQGSYRMAEVEVLDDIVPEGQEEHVQSESAGLISIYERLLEFAPSLHEAGEVDLTQIRPGHLADLFAYAFVESAYEKQSILSELNVLRRLQLVNIQLRLLLRPTS